MCNIFKWLTVEQNGDELHMYGTIHVRFFELVHTAKVLMLRFPKGYWSHTFNPISTKLYEKHGNQGDYRLLLFLAICQIEKFYGSLIFC